MNMLGKALIIFTLSLAGFGLAACASTRFEADPHTQLTAVFTTQPTNTNTPTRTPEPMLMELPGPEFLGISGSYEQNPKQWVEINSPETQKLLDKLLRWKDAWIDQTKSFAENSKQIQVDFFFDDPNDPRLAVPYLTVCDAKGGTTKYVPPKADYNREAPYSGPGMLRLSGDDAPMPVTAPEGQKIVPFKVVNDKGEVMRYGLRRVDLATNEVMEETNVGGHWVKVESGPVLTEEEAKLAAKFTMDVKELKNNSEKYLLTSEELNPQKIAALFHKLYPEMPEEVTKLPMDKMFAYTFSDQSGGKLIVLPEYRKQMARGELTPFWLARGGALYKNKNGVDMILGVHQWYDGQGSSVFVMSIQMKTTLDYAIIPRLYFSNGKTPKYYPSVDISCGTAFKLNPLLDQFCDLAQGQLIGWGMRIEKDGVIGDDVEEYFVDILATETE